MKRRNTKSILFFLLLVLAKAGVSTAQKEQRTENGDASRVSQEVRVYVTKTGSKYHGAFCSYLSKSKVALTLEAAQRLGYVACARCKGSSGLQPETSSYGSGGSLGSSVRCSGTTKSGRQCKRMTRSPSGTCYQH